MGHIIPRLIYIPCPNRSPAERRPELRPPNHVDVHAQHDAGTIGADSRAIHVERHPIIRRQSRLGRATRPVSRAVLPGTGSLTVPNSAEETTFCTGYTCESAGLDATATHSFRTYVTLCTSGSGHRQERT